MASSSTTRREMSARESTQAHMLYNVGITLPKPVRLWDYDPGFNDAANLPPLTPRFVYVQQVLFTENFK